MTSTPQSARKRGRPTEAERARRRDEILDGAVRLFTSGGFTRVTFDGVAAEARVTKRTIYNFFRDRDEIFIAAVERLRQRALDLGDHQSATLGDLATRIVHALHSDEAIALHRIMISEAHNFPELAVTFYRDGPESYIRTLRQALPATALDVSESLFSLLLGEAHRQRLLGLRPAPSMTEARAHARATLERLGLVSGRLVGSKRKGSR